MSKFFISSDMTMQEIQNTIDTSEAWDTFVFERGASFTLDRPLSMKGEGRLYNGNGCRLVMSDSFQALPRSALYVFSFDPPAKRNILQWIGYAFLRLIGRHPRETGATITGFTVVGNTPLSDVSDISMEEEK